MQVKNITNRPRSIAAGDRPLLVEPGESAEVDDELGRSLLEQSDRWAPIGKTDVSGSIPSVLAQVGDNKGRAKTALEAEQASDNPRKSLVDALSKIIQSEED